MTSNIVRTWSARATRSGADAYHAFFQKVAVPLLAKMDGFLGVQVLERVEGDEVALFVSTRWATIDHIRAFAGDDVEASVVEPEAAAMLISFDARAKHYTIAIER